MDIIDNETAAAMMMAGGAGGEFELDPLLKYVLGEAMETGKAKIIANVKHTRDYSVNIYNGIISNNDPNFHLFLQEMTQDDIGDFTNHFRCKPQLFFPTSDNPLEKQYGTVAFINGTDVEAYYSYIVKVLFINDKPLFGNMELVVLIYSYGTKYNEVIRETNYIPTLMEEYKYNYLYDDAIGYCSIQYIPQYIPEFKRYQVRLNLSVTKDKDEKIISINRSFKYCYDENGVAYLSGKNNVDEYYINNINNSNPPSLQVSFHNIRDDLISYSIDITNLPDPEIIGNMSLSDAGKIILDYKEQLWSEARLYDSSPPYPSPDDTDIELNKYTHHVKIAKLLELPQDPLYTQE